MILNLNYFTFIKQAFHILYVGTPKLPLLNRIQSLFYHLTNDDFYLANTVTVVDRGQSLASVKAAGTFFGLSLWPSGRILVIRLRELELTKSLWVTIPTDTPLPDVLKLHLHTVQ